MQPVSWKASWLRQTSDQRRPTADLDHMSWEATPRMSAACPRLRRYQSSSQASALLALAFHWRATSAPRISSGIAE